MADKVPMTTLTLAHPLTAEQARKVHADQDKDYVQGDSITLPRDDARLVINAGYAQDVDPDDHDAVRKALDGGTSKSTKAASPKASS